MEIFQRYILSTLHIDRYFLKYSNVIRGTVALDLNQANVRVRYVELTHTVLTYFD